ncbi:GNAT family N-acetyltransferase [uncultured Pseudoteredinibacter sp.]|uniref:GNAT family N-acetyltransferase n=1 Tax=uncultured Pseudoteredinibacter sp. TaxID=1641701 RepID=UPI0026337BFD|nr:GNAT family N-acetyltransferase [uncultured Pseudoteredinibacter sp.]
MPKNFNPSQLPHAHMSAINNVEVPHVNHLEQNEFQQLLQQADYCDCIFDDDDEIFGFLIGFHKDNTNYQSFNFQWLQQHCDNFLYVDRIIVAPWARSQGIGKRLYNNAAQWCKQQGIDNVVCEVNHSPPNPNSHLFHQALGFSALENVKHPEGKTVTMYQWSL